MIPLAKQGNSLVVDQHEMLYRRRHPTSHRPDDKLKMGRFLDQSFLQKPVHLSDLPQFTYLKLRFGFGHLKRAVHPPAASYWPPPEPPFHELPKRFGVPQSRNSLVPMSSKKGTFFLNELTGI